MLLRALFFIAAVALLAPHEPNLGYGSPSRGEACNNGSCTFDPAMIAGMKDEVLVRLQRVKADIAEAQRERGG